MYNLRSTTQFFCVEQRIVSQSFLGVSFVFYLISEAAVEFSSKR